ncbi:hypothetical protein HA402_000688 [Bradysia odoriphaga]|nr:hypothetical protein HA402_000688 [Bradysia odoriphaga]
MNDGHLAGLNKETITSSDISRLQALFYENLHLEELYKVRNDAKLRAVISTKTYDEFKNIVDAAHLRPITKHDKKNADTRNRLWNTSVKDQ